MIVPENVAARRIITLAGGLNFRDLGGYPAAGGKHVRWGQLFRSGTMQGLTDEDQKTLRALQLAVVFDLRTSTERARRPSRIDNVGARHKIFLHESTGGNLNHLIEVEQKTQSSAIDHITASYRTLPFRFAAIFRELFIELSRGNAPLVFHCSAGKDRTGMAAALVLSALGTPRDIIMEDYTVTNMFTDAVREVVMLDQPGMAATELQPLLVADPSYLNAAFEEIEARNGTCEAYFRDVLELDDTDLTSLRRTLLK